MCGGGMGQSTGGQPTGGPNMSAPFMSKPLTMNQPWSSVPPWANKDFSSGVYGRYGPDQHQPGRGTPNTNNTPMVNGLPNFLAGAPGIDMQMPTGFPDTYGRYGPNQHEPFSGTPNPLVTPMINGLPNFLAGAPGIDMQMPNTPDPSERPPPLPPPPASPRDNSFRPPTDFSRPVAPPIFDGPQFRPPTDFARPVAPPVFRPPEFQSKPFTANKAQFQPLTPTGPQPYTFTGGEGKGAVRAPNETSPTPFNPSLPSIGGVPGSELQRRGDGFTGTRDGYNYVNGNLFGAAAFAGDPAFQNWLNRYRSQVG